MKTRGLLYSLSLIFALIIANNVAADTHVYGPITSDTTWIISESPYILEGNVLVMAGVTLTIEAGVVVKFEAEVALQIDGEIVARGTIANMITFTSNLSQPAAGDWGYILFTDSSIDATYDDGGNHLSGSILEYSIIEYAGGVSVNNNAALRINAASPFINRCIIRENNSRGIEVFNNASPTISFNVITNNTSSDGGGGIRTINAGAVIIRANTISNNSTDKYIYGSGYYGGGGGGILVWGGSTPIIIDNNNIFGNHATGGGGVYTTSSCIIKNNIIMSNTSFGPSFTFGGGVFARYSTVEGNIIANNWTDEYGGGIVTSFDTTVTKNVIANNTSNMSGAGIYAQFETTLTYNHVIGNTITNYGSNAYGAGIYLYSIRDKSISNNTVIDNRVPTYTDVGGIYVTFTSYPVYPQLTLNYNNICNNMGFQLYNNFEQGSPYLNAENNWWGTPIESEIQNMIFDWFDDSSKGIVDFNPWVTDFRIDAPISPPTGLTATTNADEITLRWSPNPEVDTAGYIVYWVSDSVFPYDNKIDVGNISSYTLTGFEQGTYYVTVTAYDSDYQLTNDDPDTIVNENQTNGNESWYTTQLIVEINNFEGDFDYDCDIDGFDLAAYILVPMEISLDIFAANFGKENCP
jgi:hypothetical protein